MKKNKIAITMGDPSGIGTEIICKTLIDKDFIDKYDLIIIGWKILFENYLRKHMKNYNFPELNIIEPEVLKINNVEFGKIDPIYGKMSMLCVEKAVKLAMDNKVDAICTCPIHKKSIQLAGYPYNGHTEFLGELTNTKDFSMMLVGDKVKVLMVTTHIPISKVSKSINKKNILKTIKNADKAGRLFGIQNPKIAVCGLNPHAGDFGAIGEEEKNIIIPAIDECKTNINVSGPFPADSLFPKILKGKFDIVVTMYHDQGLIPVKMESFGNAVNVTVNLPIIRTSVDHGTAFDIAGKNIADNSSLKRAIEIANQMVNYA
jgi:4-hydroxythreonine-4-phosphate dehydrogenase